MSNQTNSEYQKAIDYLYQMASDGQLIVGSKIPSERELAQKTGISRNSTREAISILRGIGIVESRHGSGNYVSKDPGSSISMMIKAMLALKSTSKAEIIQVRKSDFYSVCELSWTEAYKGGSRRFSEYFRWHDNCVKRRIC